MHLTGYLAGGLAASSAALLGWHFKTAQRVRIPIHKHSRNTYIVQMTNSEQTASLWNYMGFAQFIIHARAVEQFHPKFLADMEMLYHNMSESSTATIKQAQKETSQYKENPDSCFYQCILLDSELRAAPSETGSCRRNYDVLIEEKETCEKDKGEVLDDFHDWSVAEHKKATLMVNYGQGNE